MHKTYLTRAQSRVFYFEGPVGDPSGGPAYGERRDVGSVIGFAVSVATGGAGAAASLLAGETLGMAAIAQGVGFIGSALGLVGSATGNSTLAKFGAVAGFAGGAMGLLNGLSRTAATTAISDGMDSMSSAGWDTPYDPATSASAAPGEYPVQGMGSSVTGTTDTSAATTGDQLPSGLVQTSDIAAGADINSLARQAANTGSPADLTKLAQEVQKNPTLLDSAAKSDPTTWSQLWDKIKNLDPATKQMIGGLGSGLTKLFGPEANLANARTESLQAQTQLAQKQAANANSPVLLPYMGVNQGTVSVKNPGGM